MSPIAKYLAKQEMSQKEFAAGIGITPGAISQFITGRRPVSEKVCVRIEQFTNGDLCRKTLRPDDWESIWPELREPAHA